MELKRTEKGQLYADFYCNLNSKVLFCLQFNQHEMPSMRRLPAKRSSGRVPRCPSSPVATAEQPLANGGCFAIPAACFPVEMPIRFLSLKERKW